MLIPSVLVLVLAAATTKAAHLAPIMEKCEVSNFNNSIMENVVMECRHEDSGFVVSGSGDLKVKLNLDPLDVTVQIYGYENEKYVPIPKAKITMNLCKEFKMQNIGNWQDIEKFGTLKGCGELEPGKHYIKDFPPKIKVPNMKAPGGKYRVNAKLHQGEDMIYELDFYAELKN